MGRNQCGRSQHNSSTAPSSMMATANDLLEIEPRRQSSPPPALKTTTAARMNFCHSRGFSLSFGLIRSICHGWLLASDVLLRLRGAIEEEMSHNEVIHFRG